VFIVIPHGVLSTTVLLLICGTGPARAQDRTTFPQAQVVVSSVLGKSFTLHENAVLLPDGSEITSLRHLDVRIRYTDKDIGKEPDAKTLPALWMQVSLGNEHRGRTRLTKEERVSSAIQVRIYLPRRDGEKPARFEELLAGTGVDTTASRLAALKQIDARLRDKIGRTVVTDVKVIENKTKLQITLENPYRVPIAALLHMRTSGVQERDRDVRFRLSPGEKQVRLVPLRDPHEPADPKNAYTPREIIDAFYVFPRLTLNAPAER
jgi:hypothetical protein